MDEIKVSKSKGILVTIGCFMLMVSSSVVSNSTGYFLKEVRDFLGCTAAQFSLYYSFVQICTVITCLAMGPIMKKIPRWIYLLVGALGTALGFVILSNCKALWMLYAGAMCVGFFQALIVVPPVQILNEWFPEGAGVAMGFVMGATGFGGIIMAQVMPRLVAHVSWRAGYLFCACMYLACTLIGLLLTKDESPYVKYRRLNPVPEEKKAKFIDVAKDPMFWVFVALCFIGNGCSVIDQHMSPIMQTKGFDTERIAAAMTVFNVSLLFWKISQGWMYKKATGKRFVLIYGLLSVAGYLILQTSGNVLFWGMILKTFTGAGITVVYSLVCNEYFGTEFGGTVWAFSWAAFQFGATVFSPIYGSFLDKYGSYDKSTYIGAVCTVVIGLTFFWMLTHKRNAEAKA